MVYRRRRRGQTQRRAPAKRRRKRKRRTQRGGRAVDIPKMISKVGVEFHPPGYQYLGPGTKLDKRLKRGDPGKNRLDRIAKQHDIDYSKARNIRDKWKADEKMVKAIDRLPGKKTVMERVARGIIKTKKRLHL